MIKTTSVFSIPCVLHGKYTRLIVREDLNGFLVLCLISLLLPALNVIEAICLAPVATLYHDVCSPDLRKPINSKLAGKQRDDDDDIMLPVQLALNLLLLQTWANTS